MKKFLISAVMIAAVTVWAMMRQSCKGIYHEVGVFAAEGFGESMTVVGVCAIRLMGLDEHMI